MEKVILVDDKDRVIGEMEKIEAHEQAALHRAVSIFMFNSKGEMLLQRRALTKYHSPGLWTNTACTHPRMGEGSAEAAKRRAMEEMGMDVGGIRELFYFIYKEKLDNELTEYELDHVFVASSDAVPHLNTDEVCEYRYVDVAILKQELKERPEQFTVWFKKIVERVIDHYSQNRR